ncbi:hypothetical protein TWF694_003595 [Orbilia ellipsospora]|uniref:F-box domain-containing protein n=1 Tax=Orbilia ellipsospora TaxID=2528407 RepID=A0AAV9WZI8_9PEZI
MPNTRNPLLTLLTLPPELHLEILSLLSFEDQIHTSQTCTHLHHLLRQTGSLRRTRYTPVEWEGRPHPTTQILPPSHFPFSKTHVLLQNGSPVFHGRLVCTVRDGKVLKYGFHRTGNGSTVTGYHWPGKPDSYDPDTETFVYTNKPRVDAQPELSSKDATMEYKKGSESEAETVVLIKGRNVYRLEICDISTSWVLGEPFMSPFLQLQQAARTRDHTAGMHMGCTMTKVYLEAWIYGAKSLITTGILQDELDVTKDTSLKEWVDLVIRKIWPKAEAISDAVAEKEEVKISIVVVRDWEEEAWRVFVMVWTALYEGGDMIWLPGEKQGYVAMTKGQWEAMRGV